MSPLLDSRKKRIFPLLFMILLVFILTPIFLLIFSVLHDLNITYFGNISRVELISLEINESRFIIQYKITFTNVDNYNNFAYWYCKKGWVCDATPEDKNNNKLGESFDISSCKYVRRKNHDDSFTKSPIDLTLFAEISIGKPYKYSPCPY